MMILKCKWSDFSECFLYEDLDALVWSSDAQSRCISPIFVNVCACVCVHVRACVHVHVLYGLNLENVYI